MNYVYKVIINITIFLKTSKVYTLIVISYMYVFKNFMVFNYDNSVSTFEATNFCKMQIVDFVEF